MSPASKLKSKLKENSSVRAAKEQQKFVSKHSGPTSTGNGSPGNAYNPVSGTFHSFDTAQVTSSPPPLSNNARFRNADETDEHSSSSLGTAAEYDSLSNNGSCSGESEDHKEKVASSASRQETIPGSDNEKREKIRQKNERKHQRQRERRAQELHERCSGYLMSRKLEALSQQLVAMGFTSERATLALMLNEGRVEESVNWLFEGNEEEAQKKDIKNVNNLKIDISKELAQIAALELTYKCSKQEVERAVVACEGDLVKAEETLKMMKPEPAVTPTKPQETSNLKQPTKVQDKPMAVVATQLSRNEREMNYLKGAAGVSTISEPGSRNFLPLKTNQPEPLVERRWLNSASSSSLSYSTVPPIQVAHSSAKMMGQLSVGGNEGRSVSGAVREPVMMMQRPQAMNIKQNYVLPNNIGASQPGTAEWYANNVVALEGKKLNGVPLLQKSSSVTPGAGSYGSKHFYSQAQSNRSFGPDNSNMRQYYPQAQYMQQSFATNSVDSAGGAAAAARMGGSWSTMGASSPSRTVASSLGLFSSWGSTGTSGSTSHVDWNARDMMSNCDYNSIDWTLESNSKPSGLMRGLPSARVPGTNGGVQFAGLQNGAMSTEIASSGSGPREWTSPFAGNDIFSVPRQFVTSPSP